MENMKEVPLMGNKQFKEYLENNRVDIIGDLEEGILHLRTYEAVKKFKSVRRAIRRGHVSPFGEIYPKRPFNNKANTSKKKGIHSRPMNELKKHIYEQLKYKGAKAGI